MDARRLMPFDGNFMTTGMGILPHTDRRRALDLACSVDIPFWPQLPKAGFYEDMYVQASENFPGIVLDEASNDIHFETDRFYAELEQALGRLDDDEFFRMSPAYSATYHEFLERDLSAAPAIRGQLEGPVSFGLKVLDENKKPIIFNEEVRSILFDFMARKATVQLKELKEIHPNAFMFIDEPGLQYIFSSVSGYTNDMARGDFETFFSQVEHPRGIHLCGNPDWDFLLSLDIDILSFNAYVSGPLFLKYRSNIKRFFDRGGMIGWGLVPANYDEAIRETHDSLLALFDGLWRELMAQGYDPGDLAARSILMPATCALLNPDGSTTVEQTYERLALLSQRLRERYGSR